MQTFPLHPAQQDVFIDQMINMDSPHYNVGGYLKLAGRLNKETIREIIEVIPDVFDAFKMRFDLSSQDRCIYFDSDYRRAEMGEMDFSVEAYPERAASEWIGTNFNTPFVLKKETIPFEQWLLKISDREHWIYFKYHHLMADGYAFAILGQYLSGKYTAIVSSGEFVNTNLSYLEEVRKTSDYFNSPAYNTEEKYWREKIDKAPARLLPRKSNVNEARKSGRYTIQITSEQRELFHKLQKNSNLSLQQLTLAALIIYFGRTTEYTEFIFGVSIHKRRSRAMRSTMGMFAGVLPFKGVYDEQLLTADFLAGIRNSQKSDYRYQDYPIGELLRNLKRDTRTGFFDVTVNYELLDFMPDFGQELKATIHHLSTDQENIPLRFCWRDYGSQQSLLVDIDFQYDYFSQYEVALFVNRVIFILEQLPTFLQKSLSEIQILPSLERKLVAVTFNDRKLSYFSNKTIIELFQEQVKATPEATALSFLDKSLSYQQLDRQSNQLANYLIRNGVTNHDFVPVCIERSLEMVTAILGVLKTGAAYVPIDPDYPSDRIQFMVRDCNPEVILSYTSCLPKLNWSDGIVISLDASWKQIIEESQELRDAAVTPDSTAYVMYTSGSTGTPKGVMVSHRNVTSLVVGSNYVKITDKDKLLSTGSPSFDATTFEYWQMLLHGGELVLCQKHTLLDIELMKEEIRDRKITIMWFTSSWLNQLVDIDINVLDGLSTILAGGERLSSHHIRKIRNAFPYLTIINGYGPTENTTFSTTYEIGKQVPDEIPIGVPLNNRVAYVVNTGMELCPIGVIGELLVGGDGLSKGYLNNNELTCDRFVNNPFSQQGGVLYKTGDLARWLPDGNIEFYGRSDDQVKIRGYRVELGEVEAAIRQSGLVNQVVVVADTDTSGLKRLIGYISCDKSISQQALQDYLVSKLPEHMIPAVFVSLEQIPLTDNGKVDRKSLPSPEVSGKHTDTHLYGVSVSDTERKIAEIWREVLAIERVGIYDDFFQLGGDSIKIIAVVSKLRSVFGRDISIGEVYQTSTLQKLAALITDKLQGEDVRNNHEATRRQLEALKAEILPKLQEPEKIEDLYPMSDIQTGMVYASMLDPELAVYHDQLVYPLRDDIQTEAFEKAFGLLIKKHAILRTVFNIDIHTEGIQIVYHEVDYTIDHIDMREFDENEANHRLEQYLKTERDKPFDPGGSYLWRAALIHLKHERKFVFQFHHSILDGWSVASFNTELTNLSLLVITDPGYTALQKLRCTQKDFIIESISDKLNTENNTFWQREMAGYKRLDIFTEQICLEKFVRYYEPSYLDRLKCQAEEDNISVKALLLGAYVYVLQMMTYEDDLTIGLLTNIRPSVEDGDKLLGCFLNTIPFRTSIAKSDTTWKRFFQEIEDKLRIIKSYDRSTLLHIKKITKEKPDGANPFFDTLFNFLNFHIYEKFSTEDSDIFKAEAAHEVTNTFLDCTANVTGNRLQVRYFLTRKLKSGKSLEELSGYFDRILECYLNRHEEAVSNSEIVSELEYNKLFNLFKAPVDRHQQEDLLSMLDDQLNKNPNQVAIIFRDSKYTYKELHARSNQLAHYLIKKGVSSESLVPLLFEKSVEMIVAILGVLKAGGAYVPIDPGYPEERIVYVISDTKAELILSGKLRNDQLQLDESVTIIDLESDWSLIAHQPVDRPVVTFKGDQLAYVIYTSGSTGRPKGVMVERSSVTNLIISQKQLFDVTNDEGILQFSNYTFDASVEQIFLALCSGASLIIAEPVHYDPHELIKLIMSESVTHLHATPSFLKSIDPAVLVNSKLKRVIAGGEECPAVLAASWGSMFTFYNEYGPTETTVTSVVNRYSTGTFLSSSFPIGKPIENTHVCMLDKEGEIIPDGCVGELYIAGAGLARGYLNLPDLTCEKFVIDRKLGSTEERFYKTGDLARWLPDGTIEFAGRIDDQVKIRGYRVELGEIEHVLRKSEQVSDAVVTAIPDMSGIKQLIAYVIPKMSFDKNEIAGYLKSKLPGYMVPSVIVELNEIPLTVTGKINKNALPRPDASDQLSSIYAAPDNQVEAKLAEIWKERLHVQRVGIDDNFFELGGHSLLATQVVSAIRHIFHIELAIKDMFGHPTVRTLARYVTSKQKNVFFSSSLKTEIKPSRIPLSFSQERLWFIDQLEGSIQYHIAAVLQIKGVLDVDALSKAFRNIINRHEILRTVIRQENGKPYQHTLNKDCWTIELLNERVYDADRNELQKAIEKRINVPFDLSNDHMLRAHLFFLRNEYKLLVTLHHIAADGWSMPIILRELTHSYESFSKNLSCELTPLPAQYADYAIWQRTHLTDDILKEKLLYWQRQLEGISPLNMATDFPRPSVQSNKGSIMYFMLEEGLMYRLKKLAFENDVTLFMALLAAFKVLLYKYSEQHDICVGSATANRLHPDIEPLVGFFVNALPLRSIIQDKESFTDLLVRVRNTTLDAYAHQDVPFEKIVEAAAKKRDMSRSPLFQVMFDMQNNAALNLDLFSLGESEISQEPHQITTSKFDLTFVAEEQTNGLRLTVEYCTAIYKPHTIVRMVDHYQQLLKSVVDNADCEVGRLNMITAEERTAILLNSQGVFKQEPDHDALTIVDLFRNQVRLSGKKPALVFGNTILTFEQLDERSNQLARYLVKCGVKEESLVPLCMQRGIEMIISIFAVLKAGAAYVPIDPDYPTERISYILDNTNAGTLVVKGVDSERIKSALNRPLTVIDINDDHDRIEIEQLSSPSVSITPRQLCYVIYTSGSTGKPKGVMIEHGNLLNYLLNSKTSYLSEDTSTTGTYFHLSYTFDASITSIFLPLLFGKSIVIGSKTGAEIFLDNEFVRYAPYDFIKLTPAHLDLLKQHSNMRVATKLVVGGEALHNSQVQFLFEQGVAVEVINEYGPTEATVGCSTYSLNATKPALNGRVPIGRPIDNTEIYILDNNAEIVPAGVPGEVYIGGNGVARGYLNLPALTSEKFILHDVQALGKRRLYKTGDIGRWLEDGNIEYLGRKDDQVKIRGYRVELGEIENVLLESNFVKQAIVVLKEDSVFNKKLVAYIVSATTFEKESLIRYASSKLPDYMIPSLWMEIKTVPLTTNGKVDRKRLPDPQVSSLESSGNYMAPSNEIEAALVKIWQELLGVERVGIHDNFFSLGGDSIITIQVVSQARSYGYNFQVGDLFEHQTIASLSRIVSTQSMLNTDNISEQGLLTGSCGLLPIQQWYFENNPADLSHFNQSVLLNIHRKFTSLELTIALRELLSHHDALRFKYTHNSIEWMQEYTAPYEPIIFTEELVHCTSESLPAEIETVCNNYQKRLDIQIGHLIQMVLIETPSSENSNRLLIVVHHLAIDGVSWRILLEDLDSILTALESRSTPRLGKKTASYRQWYNGLVQYGTSERCLEQKTFWKEILSSVRLIPEDSEFRSPVEQRHVERFTIKLPAIQTRKLLQDASAAYHTDVNDLLLSALAKTITEWKGESEILIGLDGHGRENLNQEMDVSRTLGWFTALYPVRLNVKQGSEFSDIVKEVKETLRRIPDKGVGFGVLKYIVKDPSFQNKNPWKITFNYLGQFNNLSSRGSWFSKAGESSGEDISRSHGVREILSINSFIEAGILNIMWSYSTRHYSKETACLLADNYLLNLNALIDHCSAQGKTRTIFTPSDYGLATEVSYAEMDNFLKRPKGDLEDIMDF